MSLVVSVAVGLLVGTAVEVSAAPASPPAEAEPKAKLAWTAPASCPSQADVDQRVDAVLARGGSGREEPVQLVMHVHEQDGMFTLEVRDALTDGTAPGRIVQGSSCAEVTEAAVLIAAIAIDPGLTVIAVPPVDPPADDPPADDPPADDPPADVPPVDERPATSDPASSDASDGTAPQEPLGTSANGRDPASPPPTRTTAKAERVLGVHVMPTFGLLARSRPSVGAEVLAGFQWPRLRLGARVRGTGPSFGTAPDGPGGGVFGHVAAGLVACYRSPTSAWSVVGCGATDVGLVAGRGRQTLTSPRQVVSPWWGAEVELGVERELTPRLSLAARGSGGAAIANPDLVIDGQGRVCCKRWSAALKLGFILRLGRNADSSSPEAPSDGANRATLENGARIDESAGAARLDNRRAGGLARDSRRLLAPQPPVRR